MTCQSCWAFRGSPRHAELPSGGWWGSLFPADPDYVWTQTGYVKCKHKGSKNREIKRWR